jgi:uncharacterized membrane protein
MPAVASPISMEPVTGPPGTDVTLTMTGLMMNQSTEVGFGTFVGHEIIGEAQAGTTGEVTAAVRVPESATPGTYYFFIAEANGSPLAVSDSFVVTPRPQQ